MNNLNYTALNESELININAGSKSKIEWILTLAQPAYDFYKGFKKGYNEIK